MKSVKPCPQTLSPPTLQAQVQPNSKPKLVPTGLGLTLKSCRPPPTHKMGHTQTIEEERIDIRFILGYQAGGKHYWSLVKTVGKVTNDVFTPHVKSF